MICFIEVRYYDTTIIQGVFWGARTIDIILTRSGGHVRCSRSNAHTVAAHNLGVAGFLPNRLTVFGVDFADFGLGVLVKLVRNPAGQIIE